MRCFDLLKLYTKTICPKCVVAKSFFNGNDVKFEVVNIDQDVEAKQKLIELGFMSVPIVEHDENFYSNMTEFQQLVDDLQ